MRKILGAKEGERKRFRATFVRTGKKINFKGYAEDTILLSRIVDIETNEMITDHLWFALTKAFEQVDLVQGSHIEFEARVKEYKKGYVNKMLGINNQKVDFKLSHPTKVKIINKD